MLDMFVEQEIYLAAVFIWRIAKTKQGPNFL